MLAIQKIQDALNNNQNLPKALLGQRVFERESEGNKELLALVYGDVGESIVWGHIFKKDGLYISCFVGFKSWFNAMDSDQLFARFWHHLSYLGDWYPLNSPKTKGDEIYYESKTFDEAVSSLLRMIKNFDVDSICGDGDDDFQTDYRILGVYPFPIEDVKFLVYPGWEHKKDIFNEEG